MLCSNRDSESSISRAFFDLGLALSAKNGFYITQLTLPQNYLQGCCRLRRDDSDCASVDNCSLFRCHAVDGFAEELLVVQRDWSNGYKIRAYSSCGVQSPAEPSFEKSQFDARILESCQGNCRDLLKKCWQSLDFFVREKIFRSSSSASGAAGKLRTRDLPAAYSDAFCNGNQVR